ncbi:MAG: YeiH family putative sulfate export transporter [Emcibacter sp.]|nr:YeiH family putative sulfate export transporter [Emcibacter sp.]
MKNIEHLKKYDYLDSIEGFYPEDSDKKDPIWDRARALIPGILICATVALAAKFIAQHYTAPVMLLCLLLGMIFHFMSQEGPTKKGVQFTSQSILRIGVGLIGARIMLSDFTALGGTTLALVITAIGIVIASGVAWAWLLKLDREQGLLIGGATAICGASAALALSTVMPKSKTLEHNTLIAVVGVTAMGTISMIFYPVLVGFLGIDDHQAGILIGGTIHDVSQVVGAGYSISEEAGDTAIIVKLVRVFMLVPILFLFAISFRNKKNKQTSGHFIFPYFLVGFLALVILNSLQLIPREILDIFKSTSKWMLIMAITAVGMKTSLKDMFSLGWRPIFLILIETITISLLYFTVIISGVV